jgi:hypothetical protein
VRPEVSALLDDVRAGRRVALLKNYGALRRCCVVEKSPGGWSLMAPFYWKRFPPRWQQIREDHPDVPALLETVLDLGFVPERAPGEAAPVEPEGTRWPDDIRAALIALAPAEEWLFNFMSSGEWEHVYRPVPDGFELTPRMQLFQDGTGGLGDEPPIALTLDDAVARIGNDLANPHLRWELIGLRDRVW